jgi:hypothetical protein
MNSSIENVQPSASLPFRQGSCIKLMNRLAACSKSTAPQNYDAADKTGTTESIIDPDHIFIPCRADQTTLAA